MSTSAFASSYSKPGRRTSSTAAPEAASSALQQPRPSTREVLASHRTSEWMGERGEQLRVHVTVVSVESPAKRSLTYLVRTNESSNLLEWSTQRRYGIAVGDRLALSGVVKTHTTRDDTRVTVLRDCFNPMRMA